MVLGAVGGLLKRVLMMAGSPVKGMESEAILLNKCLQEIDGKRKRALEKLERNRTLGTHLTTYTDDDRYADNKFYQKKLQECYDRNSKVRKALGLP